METMLDSGLIWWITVIELPAISALFYMIFKTRTSNEVLVNELRNALELRTNQLKESLASFKLDTAQTYASINDFKDLELRIITHLLRIEEKLDRTAMKAEVLEATYKKYRRKE